MHAMIQKTKLLSSITHAHYIIFVVIRIWYKIASSLAVCMHLGELLLHAREQYTSSCMRVSPSQLSNMTVLICFNIQFQ